METNTHGDQNSGSAVGSGQNGNLRNQKFAIRLKNRREEIGLTQKELAKKIGADKNTIQNYEAGGYPKGDYSILLAKELRCTLDWLLMGEGPVPESVINDTVKVSDVFRGELRDQHERIKEEWVVDASGNERSRPFKLSDAITMAARVLDSGTSYAYALYLNVLHFDRAINAENRIANLEKENGDIKQRLADLEKRLDEKEVEEKRAAGGEI